MPRLRHSANARTAAPSIENEVAGSGADVKVTEEDTPSWLKPIEPDPVAMVAEVTVNRTSKLGPEIEPKLNTCVSVCGVPAPVPAPGTDTLPTTNALSETLKISV